MEVTIVEHYLLWFLFAGAWIICQAILIRRLFKAKPDKAILSAYPDYAILLLHLPFSNKWKSYIKTEDHNALSVYRTHLLFWQLSVVIPFILFVIIVILLSGTWRYGL